MTVPRRGLRRWGHRQAPKNFGQNIVLPRNRSETTTTTALITSSSTDRAATASYCGILLGYHRTLPSVNAPAIPSNTSSIRSSVPPMQFFRPPILNLGA